MIIASFNSFNISLTKCKHRNVPNAASFAGLPFWTRKNRLYLFNYILIIGHSSILRNPFNTIIVRSYFEKGSSCYVIVYM